MVYKSCSVKSGIRERDSEFSFVLSMFRFGKIDKILDRLQKGSLGDSSCSIVFAQNLERTIAIVGEIIPTISLSIPRRYRQCRRKVVGKTNAIQGIVPASTVISSGDFFAKSSAIFVPKILFECLGDSFGFGFFCIELSKHIIAQGSEIVLQFFMIWIFFLKGLDLNIKISFVLDITRTDRVELDSKRVDLTNILASWFISSHISKK